MPYDTLPPAAAHRVELDGRERLIVSGVDDVDRFDENEIVMTTSAGTLIVTGTVSQVESAVRAEAEYAENVLHFTVCDITKT